MFYSHIIFLCVSLADPSKAGLLQVYKYKPETVELAAWTGNVSTFRSFSRTACGGRATRDGRFSFAFDVSEKTCKVGELDLEATTPNGDDGESVMLQGEKSPSSFLWCLPGCSAFCVHHLTWPLSGGIPGPLTHLGDLEAGYGGVWAPNFGGAVPGFEPRTSCIRVRSHTHCYAMRASKLFIT